MVMRMGMRMVVVVAKGWCAGTGDDGKQTKEKIENDERNREQRCVINKKPSQKNNEAALFAKLQNKDVCRLGVLWGGHGNPQMTTQRRLETELGNTDHCPTNRPMTNCLYLGAVEVLGSLVAALLPLAHVVH
mmetsp:Transcript_34303/g.57623  ORF Transcript_34303/g.57623 Transcript_34303/m.57623 type:complete len:132 (+) Transcript_34303:466-861(+)